MAISGYSIVRVFTATQPRDRHALGDVITAWLAAHADLEVTDKVVVQSSDSRFHASSIVLFLRERAGR